MGPGAAFVLHQRGVLPLHGSGIVTDHGAVLFVGHSGAGKSTLTGAFIDRGFPVVGDDLAAVSVPADGHPTVAPGTTTLKMWADSVESLGWNTDGLERVRPELAKFVVPVRGRVDAPVRLAAIYHLGTHNGRTVVFEPRERAAKFNTVLDHTWQKMTVKRMGLHGIHFRRAVAIADAVPVVGVRRPDGVAVHDSGIVDLILADLATRV